MGLVFVSTVPCCWVATLNTTNKCGHYRAGRRNGWGNIEQTSGTGQSGERGRGREGNTETDQYRDEAHMETGQ